MEQKSFKEISSIVFRAVALAMGVAVTVLSCLGVATPDKAVPLLGIGLACAGIALMSQK
ncbi:MAG: hypothetical protein Q4B67_07190 [Eubacteriales bacterium]|nr:hypothetical protein [Eubacteriales bacterium]